MPSAYDAITARLIESLGFEVVYSGGFVTGGMTCITEPLLTMTEQLRVASDMANAVTIPLVMDAGAGWGEPLHTMRTVRECIRAGVAGVHIEDQLFPKRAHYHTHVVHNISRDEYRDKIGLACKQRDEVDRDFVIIARSDACRIQGFQEAIDRVNLAADLGADLGLIFPRDHDETVRAPKLSKIPMVYVQSRGNRDSRPLYSFKELEDMGYAGCIDAILAIGVQFHFMRRALLELRSSGAYTGITEAEFMAARKQVEDLIGLDEYYRIERDTVENRPLDSQGELS
jgi:2-methylisocitrate lyase-like PEP mutase family enzyme